MASPCSTAGTAPACATRKLAFRPERPAAIRASPRKNSNSSVHAAVRRTTDDILLDKRSDDQLSRGTGTGHHTLSPRKHTVTPETRSYLSSAGSVRRG